MGVSSAVVNMTLFRGLVPLLLVWLVGCGGGDGGGSAGTKASQPGASSFKRRTAESLPAVGDYLPPLDNGRIEIAPPEDWNLLPRGTLFEAGFVQGKASELPRITLTAWDSPLDAITELTEANAEQLAAQLIKELKQDKKTVVEPPRPIVLGETLFLRHVRRARQKSGDNVVIQALETVRGGRLYSVELLANIEAARAEEYEASLTKWRDYGYAVAANLKFTSGAEPPATTTETPAETPPVAKPAEENPKP